MRFAVAFEIDEEQLGPALAKLSAYKLINFQLNPVKPKSLPPPQVIEGVAEAAPEAPVPPTRPMQRQPKGAGVQAVRDFLASGPKTGAQIRSHLLASGFNKNTAGASAYGLLNRGEVVKQKGKFFLKPGKENDHG